MADNPLQMNAGERRAAFSLGAIYSFRMLGLFMILPVFALYAQGLAGVTPTLVGLAIGIYGLTQAILQIPFGIASDRWGRKPVIIVGLVIFGIGSIVAAMADSIHGVVLGRALQGAGAVAAPVMALLADLTREENRTKAMAFIGMSIGFSFLVAMVTGPVFAHLIGVPGIFYFIAVLAVLGIGLIAFAVPNPPSLRKHKDLAPAGAQFKRVFNDPELLRINFGIFALHLVLTAGFVALPLALRDAGLPAPDHWQVYLPVMVFAMAFAVPFIVLAERKRLMKEILTGAIGVLVVVELGFAGFHQSVWELALLMGFFFLAFNFLEASLPSLISKLAPVESKGSAMGLYSTSQFLGAFVGGAAGGWLFGEFGFAGVFMMSALVLAAWWVLATTMQRPRHLSTRIINLGAVDQYRAADLEHAISAIPGVAEVAINVEDGTAYLKVDNEALDAAALGRFSSAG